METEGDTPWHVTITGLPEFDESGRQYDYVLVEENTAPRYETERDSDGYFTTVYNPRGQGEVIQILVQKNWIDDSDTVHREPVTIQAYNKHTGEAIESVTLQQGVWYDWLYISVDDEQTETEPGGTVLDGEEPTEEGNGEPDEEQEPSSQPEPEPSESSSVKDDDTTSSADENRNEDSSSEPPSIDEENSSSLAEDGVSASLLDTQGEEYAAPLEVNDTNPLTDGEGQHNRPHR